MGNEVDQTIAERSNRNFFGGFQKAQLPICRSGFSRDQALILAIEVAPTDRWLLFLINR
jgi:hypothetical protein